MAWLLISQFKFSESGLQDLSGFETELILRNGAALTEEGLAIDKLGSYAYIPDLPLPFSGLKLEVEFKMNPLAASGLPIGRQNIIGGTYSFNMYAGADGKYHANFLTRDNVWNQIHVVDASVVPSAWQTIMASCDGEGSVKIRENEAQTWGISTAKENMRQMPEGGVIMLGAWPQNIKHFRAGGVYRSLKISVFIPDEVFDRMYGRGKEDKKGKRRPMDLKQVKKIRHMMNALHHNEAANAEVKALFKAPKFRLFLDELEKQDWHEVFWNSRSAALIEMLKSGKPVGTTEEVGREIAERMRKAIPADRFAAVREGSREVLSAGKGAIGEFVSAFNPILYSIVVNLSKN